MPKGYWIVRMDVADPEQYQAAVDCYHSAAYQATIGIRSPVSQGDFVLVEGYDGPQPT